MGHQIQPYGEGGYAAGPANSSMAAVAQLFARLSQEIEEQKPPNCVHFIVNFLCKHYPEHLHGFASIWNMDPDLERERHEVVNFFKSHKISTAVAAHFTNAGYDTLDTLTTLGVDQLVDVEAFNNVKWLPGHKVRLQQIFSEIPARIRAYRQAHPDQTARIVGTPAMPTSVAAVTAGPTTTAMPGGGRMYVVSESPPVRVGAAPMAIAGVDINHDGRPNMIVAGVDRNRDGIPDVLQGGMAAAPHMARAGVDTNHDGRPNFMVTGVDRNRDGIPDVLQGPSVNMMGHPNQLALAGRHPPQGAPHPHAKQGWHFPHLFGS